MQELIRKEYNLDIEIGKKTYNFKYKQANIEETMKFMEEDNIIEWIFNFLLNHNTDGRLNYSVLLALVEGFSEIL